MSFLQNYLAAASERAAQNVPPLPLSKEQTEQLCELLLTAPSEELVSLLEERVSPGVDDAAFVKCEFLSRILRGEATCELVSKPRAIKMLGTMLGGYNVKVLTQALQEPQLAALAAAELENIIFIHDDFHTIAELAKTNAVAKSVLQSWANAEWFLRKPQLDEVVKCVAFKVAG